MKIIKSKKDAEVFAETLLNPPAPNKKLKKAQEKYLKFSKECEIKD